MSTPSTTSWRHKKASMDVLEVLSGKLLFLPFSFSLVRPELAPLLFHSQFRFHVAFWLRWLGLCQWETSSTGRSEVRPALRQAMAQLFLDILLPWERKFTSRNNFVSSNSILYYHLVCGLTAAWRLRKSLPLFLPSCLPACLPLSLPFPHAHGGVQRFGTSIETMILRSRV